MTTMTMCACVFASVVLVAGTTCLAQDDGPSRAGLRLWLDASDAESMQVDADGAVTAWRDRGGSGLGATNTVGERPRLVAGGMNGKPVVRFLGRSALRAEAIRAQSGDVTIFIVSQRRPEQSSDQKWQRLLSHWDGKTQDDNQFPSYIAFHPADGGGGPYEPAIVDASYHNVAIGPLTIGGSSRWDGQYFHGDIAEVLIYDRAFLAEDEFQAVLKYLSAKWGARTAREESGWTRVGALGETPQRVTDDLPLADQANAGEWVRFEPMSDEFAGDALDSSKWLPSIPNWLGREPAFFWDKNVAVSGGHLRLTMRKQEAPEAPKDKGYHTYTSAAVSSRQRVRYGYFEIRAKPMRSHGSSAFWFFASDPEMWTEIDVFEIGGGAPGYERKYNMNAHVFHTPTDRRHWNRGGVWMAPWDLADDFHVYGLEWTEKELVFHIDGVPVRRHENTHWHQPLNLIFDSETMPTWFGLPRDQDLPSVFEIDYVRAWQRRQ